MTLWSMLTVLLCLVGAGFFFAGSFGMVRLPDVLTRLHASSKADNVGLAFVLTGVALEAGSTATAAKLVLIWLPLVVSSATSSTLIAQRAFSNHEQMEGTP